MSDLITKMNQILKEWTQLYDVMSALSITLRLDERGTLCFNELPLCDSRDLLLENAAFDAESVIFYFDRSRVIEIRFRWPEDAGPVMESLMFGYDIML